MATTKWSIKEHVIPTIEEDVERLSKDIENLKETVNSNTTTSKDIDKILRSIVGSAFDIRNTAKTWISE